MNKENKLVPLREAKNEVKIVTQRLALLHLSFSRILVDELGWKKGKQLILKAIKEYGKRITERTKKGFQSLPKYGFWENRKGKVIEGCEFGKLVQEYKEEDIGSLYCLVDAAKTMFTNPDEKLIHTKCLAIGDKHCDFATIPAAEKDRESFFAKNKDWSHLDPRLAKFYNNKTESTK